MEEVPYLLNTKHTGVESIYSVAVIGNDVIASGSSDGNLCMTTIMQGARSHDIGKLSLRCGDPVNTINSVYPAAKNTYHLYGAIGTNVFLVDIRNMSTAVFSKPVCDDEINQICLSNGDLSLAACDDSGTVAFCCLEPFERKNIAVEHSNICSSVVFDAIDPDVCFTGGFDFKVNKWDVTKATIISTISVDEDEVNSDDEHSNSYIVNPPFVQSLASSPDGCLACGLHNGETHILNDSINWMATLPGHDNGVSKVHFCSFDDSILVTGGNDCLLNGWRVKRTCNNEECTPNNGLGGESGTDESTLDVVALCHINLASKVNDICSGHINNKNSIIVSDNTSKLKLFVMS